MQIQDTIVALATAPGLGAIAVIRLSGPHAIDIADQVFHSIKKKKLFEVKSHTVHLGDIKEGNRLLDHVLATVFKNPHSYTGQDVVELSCHGSPYIQQEILNLLLRRGARMADPGEFTLRAFLNGKMDLSQAEAVADLIHSNSASSHQVALQQMRGGFSSTLQLLRQQLVDFASLIELELDFSEEDVAFADRTQFLQLLTHIRQVLQKLSDSFAWGNVLKQGIPVAIIGAPNAGKSTLLNALLNEERALVSDIAGTTRDTIEDTLYLDGMAYRFIDTAGIRQTEDVVEQMGIERTFEKVKQARLVWYLADVSSGAEAEWIKLQQEFNQLSQNHPEQIWILLANKADQLNQAQLQHLIATLPEAIIISAKEKEGIAQLQQSLHRLVQLQALGPDEAIVSNSRHYAALFAALQAIDRVIDGLNAHIPTDLIAIDIREVIYHIGDITGEVTHDEVLGNIFSKFCIGK